MGDLAIKEVAYYNCADIIFVYFAESIPTGGLVIKIYVAGIIKFEGVSFANRPGGLKNLEVGLWALVRCGNKCTGRAKKLLYEFWDF